VQKFEFLGWLFKKILDFIKEVGFIHADLFRLLHLGLQDQ